ncbi:NERD domain-containing protein [Sporolactobacillus sp. THM7-4]|nr:NERD domain-containing protein [Sporolactobacillus sp. THM7-4]
MIAKAQFVPLRLLADQALLTQLPENHTCRAAIEDDLARRQAGWRGEQTLSYFLNLLPPERFRIFYDIRLPVQDQMIQVDALLLSNSFSLLIEAKNFSGTIYFDSVFNQMIRVMDNRQETFPNPIVQVKRQRDLLGQWFGARQFPQPPGECLVSIANAATMIKSSSNQIGQWVCHAEHLPAKIEKFLQQNNQVLFDSDFAQQIEAALLKGHVDPEPNVLKKFRIPNVDLIRGVLCPSCGSFETEHAYGSWVCKTCGRKSKSAHVPMILDYFLLHGPTMTNKQCREFLKIEDHRLVTRLLKNMNLTIEGSGKRGYYYLSPSHEWFDRNNRKGSK